MQITEQEARTIGKVLGWAALAILFLAVWVVVLTILLGTAA